MPRLRRYIEWWIRILSEPQDRFAGLGACPFAAKAELTICSVETAQDLRKLLGLISGLPRWHVLVVNVEDPSGVRDTLGAMRETLQEKDLLALPSDPDRPMMIAGFRTTQHSHFLVIVQRYRELMRASEEARKQGYYKNWSPAQQAWLEDRR